ncbi:MAG: tetratricopeptide repeat protein [bacterium]|nr:tetratricopeptide repeat protein [bacterium]
MKPKHVFAVLIVALLAATAASADFQEAMSNFKAGKYVEAAAEFQALVDQAPEYDSGYFMLAQCFLQMGKLQDSESNFQKAIELNGERFEYHYGLATTYYKMKKYSQAVGALRTAEPLAADAHKYNLFKLRGVSYAALEKWGDAIEDLEKAKAVRKTADVVDRLAVSYFNLGHHDKAIPLLKESLASAPNNDATLRMLTNALMDRGAEAPKGPGKVDLYGQALGYAEKYQKLKPTNFESSNLVGRAALGGKNYPKAEQAFTRVLEQKPDYCYSMANLGKVYIAQKKWTDAERALRDGTNCAPRMAVMHESLGFALQKQKRLPEAVAAYQKAMEIKPSNSVQKLIDTCNQNLEIEAENAEIEAERVAEDAAIKKAEQEYQEELAKTEEWKKKRERDD